MAKLTDEQKQQLERLWYLYGNEGEKWTIGNHKLIQRLLFVPEAELEESVQRYNGWMNGDPDKTITEECIAEVRTVLEG